MTNTWDRIKMKLRWSRRSAQPKKAKPRKSKRSKHHKRRRRRSTNKSHSRSGSPSKPRGGRSTSVSRCTVDASPASNYSISPTKARRTSSSKSNLFGCLGTAPPRDHSHDLCPVPNMPGVAELEGLYEKEVAFQLEPRREESPHLLRDAASPSEVIENSIKFIKENQSPYIPSRTPSMEPVGAMDHDGGPAFVEFADGVSANMRAMEHYGALTPTPLAHDTPITMGTESSFNDIYEGVLEEHHAPRRHGEPQPLHSLLPLHSLQDVEPIDLGALEYHYFHETTTDDDDMGTAVEDNEPQPVGSHRPLCCPGEGVQALPKGEGLCLDAMDRDFIDELRRNGIDRPEDIRQPQWDQQIENERATQIMGILQQFQGDGICDVSGVVAIPSASPSPSPLDTARTLIPIDRVGAAEREGARFRIAGEAELDTVGTAKQCVDDPDSDIRSAIWSKMVADSLAELTVDPQSASLSVRQSTKMSKSCPALPLGADPLATIKGEAPPKKKKASKRKKKKSSRAKRKKVRAMVKEIESAAQREGERRRSSTAAPPAAAPAAPSAARTPSAAPSAASRAEDAAKSTKPDLLVQDSSVFRSKYTVGRKINEGGFGAVWKLRRNGPSPQCVKIMDLGHDETTYARRRRACVREFNMTLRAFADEMATVELFVDALDAVECPQAFLVMPYFRGKDLFEFIDDEQYPERVSDELILEIFERIIEKMYDLHYLKGIVHGDLKPENVMILQDRSTKRVEVEIIDFGIAKSLRNLSSDSKYLKSKGHFGTKGYVAPELMAESRYNRKIDVFSAGVVLYNMVTECCLFPKGHKYFKMTQNEYYRYLKRKFKCIRKKTAIVNVLYECLAFDPDERLDVKTLIDRHFEHRE